MFFFAVCFSQLGIGAMLSWSSPSLQYLMSEKSKIPVTLYQGAWITCLSGIGSVIGYLIIPMLMDRVGRKYTLLVFAGPQIVSWILIIFARNYLMLYTARIVGGLGYSCVGLISIYVGEIAERRIRGMLSILIVVSGDLGMFMVATMGSCLTYQTMNLILFSIPVIYFLSFIFMPESPYFYLMQNRYEEAVKSLMKLRGVKKPETVTSEIERMKVVLDENQEPRKNNWRELFCSESNRKGFVIVIFAHLTPIISGSLIMIAYAQQIFEYSEFSLTPAHSFMVVLAVKILSGFLASQLIEYLGRRVLYLMSGISSAFALGFVGLSFFLKFHFQINASWINWWPLIGLIIFEITSSGISSLPFVLGGELFPVGIKKLVVTLIFVACSATSFGTELIFPILTETLGIYASFFIFAAFCLSGTLFVFYIMPETKGKTLEEIQYLLNSKENEDSEVRLRLLSTKINQYGV